MVILSLSAASTLWADYQAARLKKPLTDQILSIFVNSQSQRGRAAAK